MNLPRRRSGSPGLLPRHWARNHVIAPPAVLTQDGRVIRGRKDAEPVDLWAEYRSLQADTPKVSVQYGVVVGGAADAKQLLEKKIRELGEDVLLVMGSHGRTGLSRFLWGSKAEEIVRDFAWPVLVVKATRTRAEMPSSQSN
jgi:nucleotide-binding universal stress UspA family protein